MPHICTRCNSIFQKGDDILKGCPKCGWKKFLFTRKIPEEMPEAVQSSIITKAMGVRIPPRAETMPMQDIKEKASVSRSSKQDIPQSTQISAHQSAQQSVQQSHQSANQSAQIDEKEAEAKGNAKVESIRITAPGTYELNLPSLFEREELIMAVKEGTYLIDLTSAFRKSKKE
jgi:uncharacterized protein